MPKPKQRKARSKRPNPDPGFDSGFDFFGAFFGRRPLEPPPEPVFPLETQMLTEMLKAGYKVLAMKYHPDHEGGDAEKMLELNRIKREGF